MAFDYDRLKSILLVSGLQKKDAALFQVINQLIDAAKRLQSLIDSQTGSSEGGLASLGYITADDESSFLPNSKELVAGLNITFDDSISNKRIINSSGSSGSSGYWSPLTDGDLIEAELIFASGDAIMVHHP